MALVFTDELPEEMVEGSLDDRVDALVRIEDETVMGKLLDDDNGLLDKCVGWLMGGMEWAGAGCGTRSFRGKKNKEEESGWVVSSDQEISDGYKQPKMTR